MLILRICSWIARLAGLAALLLGLLFWIASIDLISLHMLFGILVALSLLILSVALVAQEGGRVVGTLGILYALFVPIFGMLQTRWYVLDALWLIPTLHLLIGLGAIGLAQITFTRYTRLKQGVSLKVGKPVEV